MDLLRVSDIVSGVVFAALDKLSNYSYNRTTMDLVVQTVNSALSRQLASKVPENWPMLVDSDYFVQAVAMSIYQSMYNGERSYDAIYKNITKTLLSGYLGDLLTSQWDWDKSLF